MLAKLTRKDESGFTLIELMIVIAIIGILAAIAIPQFSAYRTRSYNSAANADLRNAATAQEAYYVDAQSYASAVNSLTGSSYGLYTSDNVSLWVVGVSGTAPADYTMRSLHSSGDKTWSIVGPGGSITGN
jgi:prepilin-type N-terminal cleavage/methylation domain-containing protein